MTSTERWMAPPATHFRILNSHADQVVSLPAGARVVGSTDHCAVPALAVGDHFIGFKGHPEFTTAHARALTKHRRGGLLPEDVADAALAGLDAAPDRELLVSWVATFLRSAVS